MRERLHKSACVVERESRFASARARAQVVQACVIAAKVGDIYSLACQLSRIIPESQNIDLTYTHVYRPINSDA